MSFGLVLPSVVALLLHGSSLVADGSQQLPPTLAILDFEMTPSGRTLPPPRLGAAAAQLLLDRLSSSGHYRMLDARWLQRRPQQGPVSAELLAAAHEAGVDYLVLGSVTRFSTEDRTRTVGGLGLRRPIIGAFRRGKTQMTISIVVTVVEVETGFVVTTTTGTGLSTRSRHAFGAIGAFGGGGLSSRIGDFFDAGLDDATRKAVSAAADGIVNAAPRLVDAAASHHH